LKNPEAENNIRSLSFMDIGKQVIEIALKNGATLAGIANVKALKTSPSHVIYNQMGDYSGVGTVGGNDTLPKDRLFNWPDSAKSVLVIGLSHPKNRPELDWWDGKGTPGNRLLIDLIQKIQTQIEENLNIGTQKLHYYVERGGVFLKDAAVLAGLGCIGKNNMLVTPEYGPRIRLRALFLNVDLDPTGPVEFDPCADCKVLCRKVCPEKAMDTETYRLESFRDLSNLPARDGTYNRAICNIRMEKDVSESKKSGSGEPEPIRYCRKCEIVCPAGK
jgi:epoxyqueuosine reductase